MNFTTLEKDQSFLLDIYMYRMYLVSISKGWVVKKGYRLIAMSQLSDFISPKMDHDIVLSLLLYSLGFFKNSMPSKFHCMFKMHSGENIFWMTVWVAPWEKQDNRLSRALERTEKQTNLWIYYNRESTGMLHNRFTINNLKTELLMNVVLVRAL